MRQGKKWIRAFLTVLVCCLMAVWYPGMHSVQAEPYQYGNEMLENPFITSWDALDEKSGEIKTFWTIETPEFVVEPYNSTSKMPYQTLVAEKGWEAEGVPNFWYPYGTTHYTGITSTLRELAVGEHYYDFTRFDDVPIGYWKVSHPFGGCIHINETHYGGRDWTPGICYKAYPSGWIAYCADCGEMVSGALVYAIQPVIETIDVFNCDAMYVYECPHCKGLENQGNKEGHKCKRISWNRYKVVYQPNAVGYTGHMYDSYHMYNNETTYEGSAVAAINHLSPINYQREGYTFVGWNTKPDGTGTFYEDRAEIFNLSIYDYKADETREGTDKGVVTLYAQWKETNSTLRIDPNGGSYLGKTGITEVRKGYRTSYTLKTTAPDLTPPAGVLVHFDPQNGGRGSVPDKLSDMVFSTWQESVPFNGKLKNNKYTFYGEDGTVDTVKAIYDYGAIVLPPAPTPPSVAPGEDTPAFGGWSRDKEGSQPVGGPGDLFTPTSECTLYAQWSTLVLDSVENYVANEQKGACDLTWNQPDTTEKSYKIFRSENGRDFSQMYAADIDYDRMSVNKEYTTKGTVTYKVPYDGIYKIEAWGAQGENYKKNGTVVHTGGLGGYVSGTFYLTAGDVLTITTGGQDGSNGGGTGSPFGSGGGKTSVKSKALSTLLIAGGGGGATELTDGGGGGLATGVRSGNGQGENGAAGGGGGYQGGLAGTYETHTHTDSCTKYHVHTAECGTQIQYHKHTAACGISTRSYCDAEAWHGAYAWANYPYQKYYGFYHPTARVWFWGSGGNCDGNNHTSCSSRDVCSYCAAARAASGDPKRQCHQYTVYGCGKTESYVEGTTYACSKTELVDIDEYTCGMEEGDVVLSTVKGAYGGSSYINTGVKCTNSSSAPSVRTGDGMVKITSAELGFTTELSLDGAESPDLEAPDKIKQSSVVKKAVSSSEIKLTFDRPEDNGTDYWWQVKSYRNGTNTHLLDSNITKNTLTTGVKGYYYLYDYTETYGADYLSNLIKGGGSASYRSKGSDPTKDSVSVTTMPSTTYLHIAAVDVAGNVGKTIDIKIDPGAQAYPIVTDQVQISSTINGRDQGTVYQSPLDGKIYVRADGAGAFKLSFNSFMDGAARTDYQINRQTFAIALDVPGTDSRFVSHLPYSNPIKAGEDVVDPRNVARYMYGTSIFRDIQNFSAARYNDARKNHFEQCFAVYPSYDGKVLVVTPVAGASVGDDEDDTVTSEWSDDILHSLTLYPDGKPPVVTGLEALETMTTIDRNMGMPVFTVTAADALSGVKKLQIEVVNQNNGVSKTFYPDASGKIRMDFNDPDYELYDGDLAVTVVAVDNVGNRYERTYGTQVFTLNTKLCNVSDPTTNQVKRGGIAKLSIVTRGFADRVVVTLPAELQPGNEGLQLEFNYPSHVNFFESEMVLIRVPRDCPLDTYAVNVKAYKNGQLLEDNPELVVIDGYAFDDVRVRIR